MMAYSSSLEELTEHPEETSLTLTVLALTLAQGLDAVEIGVLGRLIVYIGDVLVTIAVLMTAHEAIETKAKNEQTKDETNEKIRKLEQQNRDLLARIRKLEQKSF